MNNLSLRAFSCECIGDWPVEAQSDDLIVCRQCCMPAKRETILKFHPECIICQKYIVYGQCGCGGYAERFTLTLQLQLRYLDIESQALERVARRYFDGDATAGRELKEAMRKWLEARNGLVMG